MSPDLFTEFKHSTAADWKAQVVKDLKGEAFESLNWKNENGFDVQPFYTSEDQLQKYEPAFTHADWEICSAIAADDAIQVNAQLLKQLNTGATSISVHCRDMDPEIFLKNIQLNFIKSIFYVDKKNSLALKAYFEKNYKSDELYVTLFPEKLDTEADFEEWLETSTAFKNFAQVKTAGLDALKFHNLNGVAYYEIAVILSGLVEFLNKVNPSDTNPATPFVVKTGVNTDYFIQIAKLRAIRRLWKILKEEFGFKNELYVIVETSLTNKSISDSYNNLLRTTVEAMSAVSGGCNELIVTEFDHFFPVNKNLSARMAVNQQIILKEESYFDKMADMSCGSYYIENMTDALAEKALENLKRFEAMGGYFKCLEQNVFTTEIAAFANDKSARINSKEQTIIGVNKFKNDKENISLTPEQTKEIKALSIHNPVLNFELENYFNPHA